MPDDGAESDLRADSFRDGLMADNRDQGLTTVNNREQCLTIVKLIID